MSALYRSMYLSGRNSFLDHPGIMSVCFSRRVRKKNEISVLDDVGREGFIFLLV